VAVVTGPGAAAAPAQAIVALDVPSADAALALAGGLDPVGFYKVGLELFTAAGPAVVEALHARGARVFLDLKLHDIPHTVAGAARSAARLGVDLLTVHAAGGGAMLRAAVDGAGDRCRILAVTVLTSMDAAALRAATGRRTVEVADEVLRLADLAAAAGAHGVVCSGHEAAAVRARHGDALASLVPGVRLVGDAAGDQRRVVTPAEAARVGARYVILGRTVTAAADPAGALARARAELGGAPLREAPKSA
jgi:orotidine-5'-phosphate decarboxylase